LLAALAAFVLGALVGVFLTRRRRAASMLAAAALLPFLALGAFAHEGVDHDAPQAHQTSGARDVARMLADGSIFVPKRPQRLLAMRTRIPEPSVARRTVELPGRIIPDPDASGVVQTGAGGRSSPPAGDFPGLGTRVRKGDVLAHVTPPLQAVDASDMRQR